MYLLDTNILSELIKRRPNPNFLSQLRAKSSHVLFTSCICVMELRFGSMLREDFEVFWPRINKEIVSRVKVVPLGEKEALIAGDILADMRKTGQSIGIEDVLIAASAITNRYIMVTANISRFSRISGLVIENWLKELG
ncbi:MAG: PIN domain-containing protein [Deltaproteobacteria bacterium]|nr:PIN domain-containing protein [Deltaproteobacteria bacterium]MBW2117961.1 PIN domain-containing protein [Deltaproteobacteria bacterium]MBW2343607.1 PIN domain-containing protein [Deltaproteobacteria bacterium]